MDALYEAHADAAGRFAYFLVGDRLEAEDIVQDAFARVLARWGSLRDPDLFGPYLQRTILNLVRNRAARRKVEHLWIRRQRTAEEEVWQPDVAGREALWRALQRLPHRQRAALVLRFYFDLSENQAAEALGSSARAVNSLVTRGLAALRTVLAHEEG